MKKLILLFSLALVSCEATVPQSTVPNQKIEGMSIKIYEIDGCQYVVQNDSKWSWGSHKGDCKNKIHIYKNK